MQFRLIELQPRAIVDQAAPLRAQVRFTGGGANSYERPYLRRRFAVATPAVAKPIKTNQYVLGSGTAETLRFHVVDFSKFQVGSL